ncbi:MAG: hypothetical protein HY822_05960 [Acidobacteria bacterium]|nr:hypothetical protein [Acidobacteriota bacterium]
MGLEWMAGLLAALLAAALAAGLVLFLALKKEIAENDARQRREHQSLEQRTGRMQASLDQLRAGLEQAERHRAASPLAGMNLSRRGQTLRLHRRGERPEQIAAALGVPLSEVELLLKLQRTMVSEP